MRKTAWFVIIVLSFVAQHACTVMARTGSPPAPDGARPIPRVRSADPAIAALIERAYEWSDTFRDVVDSIDATDGIVYVESGRCGKTVRACMALTVKVAGPSRILRIVIDPRRADCDLMASIGHELWHAIEVLRDPLLRTDAALFFFYSREGRHADRDGDPQGAWETAAARRKGFEVLAELRRHAKETGHACAPA